jgi:hypothetical protein
VDFGNWWNGVVGMTRDFGLWLTTDPDLGRPLLLACVPVLLAVFLGAIGWKIKRHLERPKESAEATNLSSPTVNPEPNSLIAVPKGPLLRASSPDSVLRRVEERGLWRIEPSYSPKVFSLVNTGITLATQVSITSDDEDFELDGPVYWEQIAPRQHEAFCLTSPPSSEPGQASLTVIWRDYSRRRREAVVSFPTVGAESDH